MEGTGSATASPPGHHCIKRHTPAQHTYIEYIGQSINLMNVKY